MKMLKNVRKFYGSFRETLGTWKDGKRRVMCEKNFIQKIF